LVLKKKSLKKCGDKPVLHHYYGNRFMSMIDFLEKTMEGFSDEYTKRITLFRRT
jgi:hypothetical protein